MQGGTQSSLNGNAAGLAPPASDPRRRRHGAVRIAGLTALGLLTGLASVSVAAVPAQAATAPSISAPPDAVVGEASGSINLPVTLSAPGTTNVTVNYAAGPGNGCNYPIPGGITGTLTFTPGVRTESVRVPINNCNTTGMADFTFNLSGAVNGVIVRPSSQVDIVGNGTVATTPGLYVRDAVVDDSVGTVEVPDGKWIYPGETCDLVITFLNVRGLAEILRVGRTWRIQEGGHYVATAQMLSLINEA